MRAHSHVGGRQGTTTLKLKITSDDNEEIGLGRLWGAEMIRVSRHEGRGLRG